ncbi:MAG: D-alanyl-D-alanine carboxypeptidase family protein [Chloroflexota bacterium]
MLAILFSAAVALAGDPSRCIPLPRSYAPLVEEWDGPRNAPVEGRRDALAALDQLLAALEARGHPAVVASGYRSYDQQEHLYAREQQLWGRPVNLPPGCSQHQLGTAFDLAFPGLVLESADPRAIALRQAIVELAPAYGFAVPYTEGSSLAPEPWHVVYVGLNEASQ